MLSCLRDFLNIIYLFLFLKILFLFWRCWWCLLSFLFLSLWFDLFNFFLTYIFNKLLNIESDFFYRFCLQNTVFRSWICIRSFFINDLCVDEKVIFWVLRCLLGHFKLLYFNVIRWLRIWNGNDVLLYWINWLLNLNLYRIWFDLISMRSRETFSIKRVNLNLHNALLYWDRFMGNNGFWLFFIDKIVCRIVID